MLISFYYTVSYTDHGRGSYITMHIVFQVQLHMFIG